MQRRGMLAISAAALGSSLLPAWAQTNNRGTIRALPTLSGVQAWEAVFLENPGHG